ASESNEENGLYKDLLENVDSLYSYDSRNKCNALSLEYRLKGNDKFKQSDYNGALNWYNKSIRFAEDSEVCLVDIDLAKEAVCPEYVASKLEEYRQTCIEALTSDKSSTEEIITVNGEPLVVANTDIYIGDTLVVARPYIRITTGDECRTCGIRKMNFIPCANCVEAMFCDKICADDVFHKIDCKKMLVKDNYCYSKIASCILRSVVVAINSFTTTDELIDFVEQIRLTDPKEISEFTESPMHKYKTFFKLTSDASEEFFTYYRIQGKNIYDTIMSSTDFADKFETLAKQRFLVHLIFHHAAIIRANGFSGSSSPPDVDNATDMQSENPDDFHCNVIFEVSYFNHSCLPNAFKLSKDGITVIRAIQPIKAGEQIFISYLGRDLIDKESIVRNGELEAEYGFRCL
ncbi:hypothetical protein Bhyg_00515, partial [Pseudolycoriella hygida]